MRPVGSLCRVWTLRVGAGAVLALVSPVAAQAAPRASGVSPIEATAHETVHVEHELPSLRAANSDTFLRSDGSRELVIYPHPVNYQVAGKGWQPIEDTLTEAGGSWSPKASPVPVSLPASLASGAVSVGGSGRQLSLQLQGAGSTAGTVSGPQRSYANVLPGVSASFGVAAESIHETLTLANASAPTSYHYSLGLSAGLQASLAPGGGVTIRDSSGHTVYSLPAPSITEPGRLPQTAPVHYELADGGTSLTLVLSKEWLSSSARTFPVNIDPDVYFTEEYSCSIVSGAYTNTPLCGDRLYVGADTESPANAARAVLYFELSSIPRQSAILSSSLGLWFEADTTTNPIEIEARGLTREWTPDVTWNDYDGAHAWTTPGGDFLKTEAGESTITNADKGYWVKWGFTPQVEQWVREPSSDHGILLKAKNETVNGYDTFVQGENGEGAPEPTMQVIYEPRLGNPPSQAMYQQPLGNGGTLGVNVANGNLHVETPDVNYATEGYDTQLSRSYNSEYDNLTGSAFGYQWTVSMGEDTLLYPSWWDGSTYLQQSDGSFTRFDRAPWADGHPETGDRAYTSEAGVPATLVVHENGTRTLTYNNTGVEWQFDNSENGYPQTVTDPGGEGNKISLSYTSSRLTKVKDTHGHELTLTRSSSTGNITKIKDGSETWTYKYTSGSYLESYEGPAGQKAEYHYDIYGDLTAIIEPAGTIVVSYDGYGRVESLRKIVNGTLTTVGSEDEITKFSYGTETTVVTRPDGVEQGYYYDAFGNDLEEPGMQEAAAEFYAGYAELGAEAAHSDVVRQDHAAILDSQLSQQLGANYVGEWFDPTTSDVKIGITSAGYEQTAEQDLDNLGLANDAEIVTEMASWSQLMTAEHSLYEHVEGLINSNRVVTGASPEHDAVTIEEADSLTTAQKKEVSEAVAALAVPTAVTEASTATVGGAPKSAPCSDGSCGRPLRGGVRISYHPSFEKSGEPTEETDCTAGYIVTSIYNALPYVLTAGHCVRETIGDLWYAEVNEVPIKGTEEGPYGELGVHKIGKAHSYVFGKSHEIPGGTTSEGDAGLIAIEPKGFWGNNLTPIIITYKGSETTRNERYPIIGTHYNPEAPQAEFVVCVGGVGKGETEESVGPRAQCGLDKGFVSPHYQDSEKVQHLEEFDPCYHGHTSILGRGNSGAPVYKANFAYGILSGGSGCKEYYEGIDQAEKALHVKVMTGPGPVE
jgi:hypothetical protein